MDLSNITVNMQSSIKISGSKKLYFDAFEINEEAHDADYIFVTHEHYDHFSPESIMKIMKDDSVIIAPESMKKKIQKELSISDERCVFCKPQSTYELTHISFETVPAYNKLKPFHAKSSKWVGYIVTMDDIKYYVAGDTDANADNKNVKCDVAIVPIGGHFTMDTKQAADFVCEIKPSAVIPTHYGNIVGKVTDGADFKKYIEDANADIQVELKL